MNNLNRRAFLGASGAFATAVAMGGVARTLLAADAAAPASPASPKPPQPRPNHIAISTYSFWRFMDGLKLPIERCIEEAAAMGFDALEEEKERGMTIDLGFAWLRLPD